MNLSMHNVVTVMDEKVNIIKKHAAAKFDRNVIWDCGVQFKNIAQIF